MLQSNLEADEMNRVKERIERKFIQGACAALLSNNFRIVTLLSSWLVTTMQSQNQGDMASSYEESVHSRQLPVLGKMIYSKKGSHGVCVCVCICVCHQKK